MAGKTTEPEHDAGELKVERCGIIMPISSIENCSEAHWAEVLAIISSAVESVGFSPNLVSNSDDVGVIQKNIIQNLYDNPIVVCDVSAKNPNVMFELGMRLAFDKPTIIIKDDATSYSFDTSPIEHITYPRDLRFSRIVEFKKRLSEKVSATHKRATTDKDYTTFLKNFGEFTVAKISEREVPAQDFMLQTLVDIQRTISRLERTGSIPRVSPPRINLSKTNGPQGAFLNFYQELSSEDKEFIKATATSMGIRSVTYYEPVGGKTSVSFSGVGSEGISIISDALSSRFSVVETRLA